MRGGAGGVAAIGPLLVFFWEEQRQSDTCGSVRVPGPGLGLALLGLALYRMGFQGPKEEEECACQQQQQQARGCSVPLRRP
jgi:hypothetical protein